jgi:hypothetical protein
MLMELYHACSLHLYVSSHIDRYMCALTPSTIAKNFGTDSTDPLEFLNYCLHLVFCIR